MLPQKPPRTQNNSLLHSTWSVPLRSGDTMAYLGILLTAALYRTIDPCTVDRPWTDQNAEHCLSKQVLSQHPTPQLSSIFPLSHLCLHKNQTHQGRQNCSAAQHTAAHSRCSDTAADSHKPRVSTALSVAFSLLWHR